MGWQSKSKNDYKYELHNELRTWSGWIKQIEGTLSCTIHKGL